MARDKRKVLLLAGGDSSERAVSLDSGKSIYGALVSLGHEVTIADPARLDIAPSDDPEQFFSDTTIDETPPEIVADPYATRRDFVTRVLARWNDLGCDVVFNGLHGGVGEDGTIQAVFDYLGIPYTGSGACASAVCMDKVLSKKLAKLAGTPVASDIYVDTPEHEAVVIDRQIAHSLSFPVVVKPNHEGSSVGVTIVSDRDELDDAISAAKEYGGPFMVEKFIPGCEITAAMLDYCELPLLEIKPKDGGFFDYKNKYQKGACEYLVPAQINDVSSEAIAASATQVYKALGCRGYARIDFRLSEDGYHFFLEANTLPGMTSNSLVPKAAKAAGIEFPELIDKILHLALHEPRDTVKKS
jgi:D-alanine-D-alanine ligase